jgi:uncharacterized protein (DUF2235 family)
MHINRTIKKMIINKKWHMPNKNTFSIKPFSNLIYKYINNGTWLDPFCRNSVFKNKCITNDLNPNIEANYNLDALEFLKLFDDSCIDGVLLDPPYSPRQVKECYDSIGKKVTADDTKISFWSNIKKEIARVVKPGGTVISFGWNTNGIGKKNYFKTLEILIVSHGSMHNDTLAVVEKKIHEQLKLI